MENADGTVEGLGLRMNHIIKEDIEGIIHSALPWEKLAGKSILITGANGYLATYMVYTLLGLNDAFHLNLKVIALCRNKERAFSKFGEFKNRDDLITVIQDVIDDIDDQYRADFIIHAASPANAYAYEVDPYGVFSTNILGYHNLLRRYEKWNAEKILAFSSYVVYGDQMPEEGTLESYRGSFDFTDYRHVYALSKQMTEMMSGIYTEKMNADISVVRPAIIYGPGMGYSQKKHITDFVKNYLFDDSIQMKSTGDVVRSFLYIKDAVLAFFTVLIKDSSRTAYNVCSENAVCSIRELAEIFTTLDRELKVVVNIPPEEEKNTYLKACIKSGILRNQKLRELGWEEETSLRDGIRRTVEWAKSVDFINM